MTFLTSLLSSLPGIPLHLQCVMLGFVSYETWHGTGHETRLCISKLNWHGCCSKFLQISLLLLLRLSVRFRFGFSVGGTFFQTQSINLLGVLQTAFSSTHSTFFTLTVSLNVQEAAHHFAKISTDVFFQWAWVKKNNNNKFCMSPVVICQMSQSAASPASILGQEECNCNVYVRHINTFQGDELPMMLLVCGKWLWKIFVISRAGQCPLFVHFSPLFQRA